MPDPILPVVADAIIPILTPIVVEWTKYLMSQGKDPAAELELLMKTADASADAAETAKFGPP